MSDGILMVAFGEQYDRFAAHAVAYSRKYTDARICVLSNLRKRCDVWNRCPMVEFRVFDLPQSENRAVKTTMIEHTPFDRTVYLDCDAIIQKPGIERVFSLITSEAVILNIYGRWRTAGQATGLYRKAFSLAKVTFPVNIYYGALVGFAKSKPTQEFFRSWNRNWQDTGRGREMPALACAVRQTKINVRETANKDGIFSWRPNRDAIIQHEYGSYVRRLVGCPEFKAYKPFDRRNSCA